MPAATNDTFTLFENAGDALNLFGGSLFEDNGSGADSDLESDAFSITHINGRPLIDYPLYSPPLIAFNLAAGSEIDIVESNGNFVLFLQDRYDWLPAGKTATENFTYTITDANSETSTATVSFTIIGIDSNDRFTGTNGRNIINAGIGNDTLSGLAGNDVLRGGTGDDRISGGNGTDLIIGGPGADVMTGGGQRDIFDFDTVTEIGRSMFRRDAITDFKHGQDDIDLRTIDASTKAGGNQAFHLIGSDVRFTKSAGELRVLHNDFSYNKLDTTVVEGDINGDGRADFQLVLTGLKTLTPGDFLL